MRTAGWWRSVKRLAILAQPRFKFLSRLFHGMPSVSARVWLVLMLASVLSCGGSGEKATAPPVLALTTITVTLSASTIQVGQSTQANAVGLDQNNSSIATGAVSWSSSSPAVATISSAGSINAVAPGQTTITAAAGSKSGSMPLTVIPVPVANVTVSPATVSVILGATQQFTAAALDASGNSLTGRLVTWTSSDVTKAAVSGTGLVMALAAGTATVTATSEGKSGSALFTITLPTAGPDGVAFVGSSGNTSYPVPDPALAVGTDRIVLISNSEVVITTKAGAAVDRVSLQSFFAPLLASGERSQGDVAALFDESTGRFFLAEAANLHPQSCVPGTCVGHNFVAVSRSSTPSSLGPGDWHLFAFDRFLERASAVPVPTTIWADYDNLAVNGDALYITSRRYGELDDTNQGAIIRMLDKTKLTAGTAPGTWTDFTAPPGVGINPGMMPARNFGASSVQFFVSRALPGYCGWTLWGLSGGLTAQGLVSQSVQLSGSCNVSRYGLQPGDAPTLDVGGSGSLARTAVYRNGRLWMAETFGLNPGAGAGTVIKWAELDVSQWPSSVSIVQQGSVGSDGVWSFYPAIMVDPAGTMVLAFNTTSASTYPSINVAVRFATDPAGTTRPTTVVKAGTGASVHVDGAGRNRFGDYLSIDLDPVTFAFWLHGQYGTAGDSRTWVAQIKP